MYKYLCIEYIHKYYIKYIYMSSNTNQFNTLANFYSPNLIYPVTTMQQFDYNVYSYYNQYYASAQITQNRRVLRNYYNNQKSIAQANKNPFINNKGKKFNFLYTNQQNYRIIENKDKSIDVYIYINNCWCHMKHFQNINDCKKFIT